MACVSIFQVTDMKHALQSSQTGQHSHLHAYDQQYGEKCGVYCNGQRRVYMHLPLVQIYPACDMDAMLRTAITSPVCVCQIRRGVNAPGLAPRFWRATFLGGQAPPAIPMSLPDCGLPAEEGPPKALGCCEAFLSACPPLPRPERADPPQRAGSR
ncbi:hypothetical protein LY78DRAFT_211011 [Colletotrichum sublineola]|nr:hypothetical protein LY78DRAFT_211011 [Colletotrichum sublineola]